MRIGPDNRVFDENNKCVGYVENGELYGYDQDGYAVLIGNAERNEIIGKLKEWRKHHG